MSNRPYFRFFPSDYLHDTRKLSLELHGAYLLLLCEHWRRGHIPLDIDELRAVFPHLTRPKIRQTLAKLSGFFVEKNGKLFSKRLLAEIEYVTEKSEKSRAAARVRWDADAMRPDMRTQCQPDPDPEGEARPPMGRATSPVAEAPKEASKVKGSPDRSRASGARGSPPPSSANGGEKEPACLDRLLQCNDSELTNRVHGCEPQDLANVLRFYEVDIQWPCDCPTGTDRPCCDQMRALYRKTVETLERVRIKI